MSDNRHVITNSAENIHLEEFFVSESDGPKLSGSSGWSIAKRTLRGGVSEGVDVVDVDNGARLVTYCIEGPPGSGTVCINGAAARLIFVGDKVIIISYAQMDSDELDGFSPTIIVVDAQNHVQQVTALAST